MLNIRTLVLYIEVVVHVSGAVDAKNSPGLIPTCTGSTCSSEVLVCGLSLSLGALLHLTESVVTETCE